MKNLYTKNEFLELHQEEILNEGLLGKLFKNIGNLYDKVKGGKELKIKVEEYKKKLKSIFDGMANAETEKIAAANESLILEAGEINQTTNTQSAKPQHSKQQPVKPQQPAKQQTKTEIIKPTEQPNQPNQPEQKNVLSKEQLKQKIENSKKRIEELKKNFNNEIDALKRKYTKEDGTISKKLEYSMVVAKNDLSDFVYQQWEDFYGKIGNQKAIQEIQKQRALVTKEMKKNTEALKRMVEGGDIIQKKFEIGQKYKYTTTEGEATEITIKEIDPNTGKVIKAVNQKGKELTPYTQQIGEQIVKKKGEKSKVVAKTEQSKV